MPKKHHIHEQQAVPGAAPLKPGQPVKKPDSRYVALDAVRGLAILAMIFSGVIPYGQSQGEMLPGWMYHGQDPPPTHVSNPALPGITWVDVVFPFFLFSMGVAIPIALSRRLDKGKWWSVVPGILWRGVLLAAFAYFRAHVDPYSFSDSPSHHDWLTALWAMPAVFLIWWRAPQKWPLPIQWLLRLIGWAWALVLLSHLTYSGVGNLTWNQRALRQWVERADIIILVLANVSVAGSLIWLATRRSWWARLAPVGLIFALRISSMVPGWAADVWSASPFPWLYRMEFMKYLMIILPGTIIGDMLVGWLKASAHDREKAGWGPKRLIPLALVMFACLCVCVVGLRPMPLGAAEERTVVETTLIVLGLLLAGAFLVMKPVSELDRMLARLFQWGAYWLILGLVLEPYEGGIKKTFTTMSYFFVTLGLGILTLAAFTILTERLRGRWSLALLTDNGQNPLLAYIAISNLVLPLMVLSGTNARLNQWLPGAWPGVLHGAITTLVLALLVSAATRLKVFVRA